MVNAIKSHSNCWEGSEGAIKMPSMVSSSTSMHITRTSHTHMHITYSQEHHMHITSATIPQDKAPLGNLWQPRERNFNISIGKGSLISPSQVELRLRSWLVLWSRLWVSNSCSSKEFQYKFWSTKARITRLRSLLNCCKPLQIDWWTDWRSSFQRKEVSFGWKPSASVI